MVLYHFAQGDRGALFVPIAANMPASATSNPAEPQPRASGRTCSLRADIGLLQAVNDSYRNLRKVDGSRRECWHRRGQEPRPRTFVVGFAQPAIISLRYPVHPLRPLRTHLRKVAEACTSQAHAPNSHPTQLAIKLNSDLGIRNSFGPRFSDFGFASTLTLYPSARESH
jgi:hypothetical protein